MNLSYIRYFVTLAHVRHYTKAAEQLCITQPSLSHAVTQLEKELGIPLFEKNGRNTTLTQFGEEFSCLCRAHVIYFRCRSCLDSSECKGRRCHSPWYASHVRD